jgi:hydroxymethylpyrimidine pyrophosphatase-like HAD family hydrolase
MERHELLFRLYEEFDTETLRAYQDFVDLLPPMDSQVGLDQWNEMQMELGERRERIASAFDDGEMFAAIASRATRDQAFTALDLVAKYERGLNALVLDVDETLRSAGNTDNEIPRETLYLLTRFHDQGVPIVICTGQTLENVKGFLIQGLGNEIVYSGSVSIVYEAGTGVFTPGHGPQTKQLLYDDLDEATQDVFTRVRSNILPRAPDRIRRNCHLQGNEFNVTLKPNFENGTEAARGIIDEGLAYLLDLLTGSVETVHDLSNVPEASARRYYADQDPEIAAALEATGSEPDIDAEEIPVAVADAFEEIDVGYYEADAAEITSLELTKVVGVEHAFDVLGVTDPFALVMGDSKSDLRVMEWLAAENAGIAAAPTHASEQVLDHVESTDDLVFDQGNAAEMLRIALAMNHLAPAERS